MRLTVAVTRDDGMFVARCLEVEVTSQGPTVEAALANVTEALELYFDDGLPQEPLEPVIVATVEVAGP